MHLKHLLFTTCMAAAYGLHAQPVKVTSTMYSARQADSVLAGTDQQALGIQWPIYRAWQYTDRSGVYFCVLTESRDTIIPGKDTASYHIRAVFLKKNGAVWERHAELNDHALREGNAEWTIWFWTKYCGFGDLDGDGVTDPLIVYGASNDSHSWHSDGRLKIILFHKGRKVAIRHTNSSMDFDRETQVDAAFYQLPAKVQSAITGVMELIVKNGHAIFPYGWQKNMRLKKTSFSERQ